jgi:Mg2+-importing ATPase
MTNSKLSPIFQLSRHSAPHTPAAQSAWWLQTPEALRAALNARDSGLTNGEARARLRRQGPNTLAEASPWGAWVQLGRRFRNPLVLILLVASAVSGLTGNIASFLIIATMVVISVALDFAQEYRADQAAKQLRQRVRVRVSVIRDGTRHSIPVTGVVRGDIVLLAAGDLVPADGRVLDAKDLFVNQSLLTGESAPVEKSATALPATATEPMQAINALFMGTSVVSGMAKLLICRTGAATLLGGIADQVARPPPPNAFEIGVHRFGMLIVRLTFFMVLFVLFANTLTHKPWLDSFLFAVALAVGLTPELLPMVVSVTLSRGALRMAAKDVIVKRLIAIQNLGAMDVLCTDKTGTLTEGAIRLDRHVDPAGADNDQVLLLGWLNSHFETGLRSPLDTAIIEHGKFDAAAWSKIDEVPFDFERRRVSVLVDDGNRRWLIAKGAPDEILSVSACTGDAAGTTQLDSAGRARVDAQRRTLESDGLRVLAVAWKEVGRDHAHAVLNDESALIFAGFLAFSDPPKASAGKALHDLAAQGVAVTILTGDSEVVTAHVCRELGLAVRGVLTGSEMSKLDEPTLRARVDRTNLFCRVNPAQKNRIIAALRARGHVVGYLGDGINDAPALHTADVGMSVDTAVDVAKEAADIILLRHDLGALRDGVVEGRRTFGNIRKYILMGTSSNFGNMFSMAGAALFLPFLPMLPMQVLLNNVLYDLSELAIPLDEVDAEDMLKPQRWDMRFVRNFMWVMGPVSSLFDFITFAILLYVVHASEKLFQTGWFIESLATQVLVILVLRTRRKPWASRPSRILLAAALGAVGIGVALPFTPLGRTFGFVALPAEFLAILAALVLAYLALAEAVKRIFYARFVARAPQPAPHYDL